MKRFVFAFVVLTLSGNVAAKWERVFGNEESQVYVDMATIRRSGNIAKMWTLNDYTEVEVAGKRGYLSQKVMLEFDCANELMRAVSAIEYTGQLGAGVSVGGETDFNAKWVPIPPSTRGETLWKMVCLKK